VYFTSTPSTAAISPSSLNLGLRVQIARLTIAGYQPNRVCWAYTEREMGPHPPIRERNNMASQVTRIAAAVITSDFRITEVELDAAHTLDELYRLIQCRWVDVVALDKNVDMWIDDEGMYANDEPNWATTTIAHAFGFVAQPYFGTAVFTGGVDEDGNSTPLDPQSLQKLTKALAD